MTLAALLAIVLALPTYKEDRPVTPEKTRQLQAVSAAVLSAAKTPDEAAFLLTWGRFESNYSLRIHAGRCRPNECDRGRARGPWQLHRRASMPLEQWDRMHGVEHVAVQAEAAASMARWALRTCRGDVRGAFSVLGGRGCAGTIRGIDERVRVYRSVRSKL